MGPRCFRNDVDILSGPGAPSDFIAAIACLSSCIIISGGVDSRADRRSRILFFKARFFVRSYLVLGIFPTDE